jgi:RimJ/RimL family protein N-acetyltransferase
MYAKVLLPDMRTTFMISRLLYEKHIYHALDDEMHDVFGVHRFFREIEDESRLCIGVFRRKDSEFMGCCHGMIYPQCMEGHILFKRGVNGQAALKMIMDECRKYYRNKKIPLHSFSGVVADNNQAVKLLLKKSGFEDKGILENEFFLSQGNKIPCRYFKKEIK